MSDKRYLVQRRQGWYVQIRVPDSLYHHVGKRKIVRTLHTQDLEEARSLRWVVVKEIKAYLDNIRKLKKSAPIPNSPAGVIDAAKQFRREAELGLYGDPECMLESALTDIEQKVEAYQRPSGKDAVGVQIDPESGYREDTDPALMEAFRLAKDILTPASEKILLASQALEEHISEITERVRIQTRKARERRVNDFLKWLGGDKRLVNITKQDAGRYLTQKLMKMGKSVKTTKDTLSDLSAFFNWCVDRGVIETNPFRGLSKSVKATSRGTKQKKDSVRRQYTADELVKLLTTIKEERGVDDPLWGLTVVGLFTGMRGNEIAEIELTDVYDSHIHIPEGKTDSSVRDVPIHPLIKPLVKRLHKESTDGYLISGLKRGGDDDKRYHVVGKRFSTLLRSRAGISDKRVVFHSLRKNFSTALENAGVPESTAQQIVGHKKQSMTYGLYSHGVDLNVLKKAVSQVDYGKKVSALIKNVSKKSRGN